VARSIGGSVIIDTSSLFLRSDESGDQIVLDGWRRHGATPGYEAGLWFGIDRRKDFLDRIVKNAYTTVDHQKELKGKIAYLDALGARTDEVKYVLGEWLGDYYFDPNEYQEELSSVIGVKNKATAKALMDKLPQNSEERELFIMQRDLLSTYSTATPIEEDMSGSERKVFETLKTRLLGHANSRNGWNKPPGYVDVTLLSAAIILAQNHQQVSFVTDDAALYLLAKKAPEVCQGMADSIRPKFPGSFQLYKGLSGNRSEPWADRRSGARHRVSRERPDPQVYMVRHG